MSTEVVRFRQVFRNFGYFGDWKEMKEMVEKEKEEEEEEKYTGYNRPTTCVAKKSSSDRPDMVIAC